MAPSVPAEEPPPKFESVDDEISWYEGKLERANSLLATRNKNLKRLDRIKQNAEESDNPSGALARYESSKKIVEKNLASAQAKVAELEQKLADLRGQ